MSRVRLSVLIGLLWTLLAATTSSAQQRLPPAELTKGRAPLKGFSLTLILAGSTGDALSSLPPAVVMALTDLKAFLPYQGFRHLDTAWTTGVESVGPTLFGADGHSYRCVIRYTRVYSSVTRVDVIRLWEESRASDSAKSSTPSPLVETSFTINDGETVVLGTSRPQSKDALLLLVTAVPN